MNGLLQTETEQAPAAAPPASLTFRLVTEESELNSLASDWQELLDRSALAEPMMTPSWLLTWWRIYGGGRQLRVGLFHDRERLVGMIPLCSRRKIYRPGLPFRRLEYLGSDVDENDGVCSEYLGPVVEAGHEAAVSLAFALALRRGAFGKWDELVLSAMDGSAAPSGILMDGLLHQGMKADRNVTTLAPFLTLPASWEVYLKSLGKKKRQALTYALRDFETWAGPDWQLVSAQSADDLAEGRRILKDLHRQRWEADGQAGAFAAARFAAFHDEVMPKLFAEGKMELLWLRVGGEPAAVHYHLRSHDKVYFYQSGRRQDVPAKVRLGIVMVALAIQSAIGAGLREFDFLGGPAFYKTQFTPVTRPIVQIRVARPCMKEILRRGAERGIRLVRAARGWWS